MTQRSTRILCLLLLSAVAFAQAGRPAHSTTTPDSNQSQIAKKKSKNGPRAIGVVEFMPGGKARLVPIALWMDGRFYDASLYGANPAPFAIQPETVYEATNCGETTGLFTITNARELKGNWVGDGAWRPRRALDEKLAAQAAKAPKPKPAATSVDDERPVLRRPGSSGSTSTNAGGAQASDASKNSGGSDGTKTAGSAPTTSSSPAEDDPNRPTLKKPSSTTSTAGSSTGDDDSSVVRLGQKSPAPPPPSAESDPNRPVLRRGKPEPSPAANAQANPMEDSQPGPAPGKAGGSSVSGVGVRSSFPAVSDAGAYEPRSLLYGMTPEERAAKADQMRALAMQEIGKFIATRHTPTLPKAAQITDYDLRSFDLDYSNTPTLVLTAKLPVPGAKAFRSPDFDYFVTVVAREDVNGQPIKIFSSVSDSNHLDAFPNMEIIDAVDADANGRGDLLFRQYSDTGVSYSLFRVFPYSMEKVFEGGSGV
jgi:hypothetical protein